MAKVSINLDEISSILKQMKVVRGAPYYDHGKRSREEQKEYLRRKGAAIKNIDQWRLRLQKKEERRRARKRKFKMR
jgi:hypothetical protein